MKRRAAHAGGMGEHRFAIAAALLLFAAACGNNRPTVIDGSSPAAFERSAAEARRDIPDADRLVYDTALMNPPGKRYGDKRAETEALARLVYDGMTGAQVVAEQKAREL